MHFISRTTGWILVYSGTCWYEYSSSNCSSNVETLVKEIQQMNFNTYWEGKLEEDLSFVGKMARVHSFHYRQYVCVLLYD